MKDKDFDGWNDEKKKIDSYKENKYPKERQIRYVVLWINVWYETDWKSFYRRPVLVLKRLWKVLFCVPLTTKRKQKIIQYELKSVCFKNIISSFVMITQTRVLDTKRFIHYTWKMVSQQEFQSIKKLLIQVYFWEASLSSNGLEEDPKVC